MGVQQLVTGSNFTNSEVSHNLSNGVSCLQSMMGFYGNVSQEGIDFCHNTISNYGHNNVMATICNDNQKQKILCVFVNTMSASVRNAVLEKLKKCQNVQNIRIVTGLDFFTEEQGASLFSVTSNKYVTDIPIRLEQSEFKVDAKKLYAYLNDYNELLLNLKIVKDDGNLLKKDISCAGKQSFAQLDPFATMFATEHERIFLLNKITMQLLEKYNASTKLTLKSDSEIINVYELLGMENKSTFEIKFTGNAFLSDKEKLLMNFIVGRWSIPEEIFHTEMMYMILIKRGKIVPLLDCIIGAKLSCRNCDVVLSLWRDDLFKKGQGSITTSVKYFVALGTLGISARDLEKYNSPIDILEVKSDNGKEVISCEYYVKQNKNLCNFASSNLHANSTVQYRQVFVLENYYNVNLCKLGQVPKIEKNATQEPTPLWQLDFEFHKPGSNSRSFKVTFDQYAKESEVKILYTEYKKKSIFDNSLLSRFSSSYCSPEKLLLLLPKMLLKLPQGNKTANSKLNKLALVNDANNKTKIIQNPKPKDIGMGTILLDRSEYWCVADKSLLQAFVKYVVNYQSPNNI